MIPPPMISTSITAARLEGFFWGMAAGRGRPRSAHLLRQLCQADQTERGKPEEQAAQPERPACGLWCLAVDQKPGIIRDLSLPGVTDGSSHHAVANARAADGD